MLASGRGTNRQHSSLAQPRGRPYLHPSAHNKPSRNSSGAAPAAASQKHSQQQQLFQEAWRCPGMHDWSLDFDRTYAARRQLSVPVCMEDDEPTAPAAVGNDNDDAAPARGRADSLLGFLQYQQLVSAAAAAASGDAGSDARATDLPHDAQQLLTCAVLIARHAHASESTDLTSITAAVAALGRRAAAAAATAARQASGGTTAAASGSRDRELSAAVSRVLYEEERFRGAVDDFYHPDNQCINRLLKTKQGSPALLALLHTCVAAAAGLRLVPVTLPGHTFLAHPLPAGPAAAKSDSHSRGNVNGDRGGGMGGLAASFLIDPFNAGQICSSSVVEARISSCWGCRGQALTLDPAQPQTAGPSATAAGAADSACSSRPDSAGAGCQWRGDRALLVRLLRNLREAYFGPLPLSGRIRWALQQQHLQSGPTSSGSAADAAVPPVSVGRELLSNALAVVRLHRATAPQEIRLLRDEGLILVLLGRGSEGGELLQAYLAAAPAATDAHQVQEFVIADAPLPSEGP